jgi:hypothetical protein
LYSEGSFLNEFGTVQGKRTGQLELKHHESLEGRRMAKEEIRHKL